MEEGKKKIILTAVAVVCLVLAGAIVVMRTGSEKSGVEGIKRGVAMTWVKCNNPDCNAEYEMDMKDYYDEYQKAIAPSPTERAPLVCKKCSQQSLYKANKCAKCGKVFFPTITRGDYPDRCTYCNYSTLEEKKKAKGG